MKKVYIASPYTQGDVGQNVGIAMSFSHAILDNGHCPISPLLSHFLHIHRQRHYEDWIAMDLELVKVSDCLIRLPGDSNGADGEVRLARELGIPVFYDKADLFTYLHDTRA